MSRPASTGRAATPFLTALLPCAALMTASVTPLAAQAPPSAPAAAPLPVVAADAGVIRAARVEAGRFTRRVSFVREGQERPVGTITEVITERGTELVRAQEIALGGRTVIDTAVSRRATLAPLWHSSKQPAAAMALRFDGTHVTGSHTTGSAAPVAVDHTVSVSPFDSNNQELVLGALPLAPGYRVRLPMYVYESKGISWCDVTDVREEALDGAPAWKLGVTYAGAHGTYWYARDSRVLLRYDMVLPTGALMRVVLVP